MSRAVKYVDLEKSWWYGHVNEEYLTRVVSEAQEEGWIYQGLEDHGWIVARKWVAKFVQEGPAQES